MTKVYPAPIISTQPGSWANSAVLERWPETAEKILNENELINKIQEKVTALINDIPDSSIRQLKDGNAPDSDDWISYIAPFEGKNWLEIPWLFGEHYFYRRIIEAVDYFRLGQDPFQTQKKAGLIDNQQDIEALTAYLNEIDNRKGAERLRGVIYYSLWGNQADLSLWAADSVDNPKHNTPAGLKAHLLADDTNRILQLIKKKETRMERVDFILDNAGFELVCDLGLTDAFLKHDFTAQVVLHAKAHPTFVSDVIEHDILSTIDYLLSSKNEDSRALGLRLEEYLKEGRIKVNDHFFWNSPLPMWKLPDDLQADLAKSELIISKGDANYRRLLGDLEWDFTLPFHQVVDYLPSPLAALRTSKAELALGLNLDQIQETYNQDPKWLVNGKWGMIQFAPGVNKART